MSDPPADHPEIRADVERWRSPISFRRVLPMAACDHIDTLLFDLAAVRKALDMQAETTALLLADNTQLRKVLNMLLDCNAAVRSSPTPNEVRAAATSVLAVEPQAEPER